MATTSSVRMKLGPVEFECTASEEFLEDELPALIASMAQLYKEHFADGNSQTVERPDIGSSTNGTPSSQIELTTNSIAAKLKVKTGTDLALAAAVRLSRMGKTTFTRAELLERMREAPSYFKQTYLNNLTSYINTLMGSQKLLQSATDTYALSEATKTELEARLAQR